MKVSKKPASKLRSGLSWTDVFVCLAVLTLIFCVILPGLNLQSHRPARKMECLNNMRNLALAIQNYCANTDGTLPRLTTTTTISNESSIKGTMLMPWPVTLLPALDATAVLKQIKLDAVAPNGEGPNAVLQIADAEKLWLPVFTCPQDLGSYRQRGGLSFVLNIGIMPENLFHGDPNGLHRLGGLSWNGNDVSDELEDIQICAATGVIWRPNDNFYPSLDYISEGDGTSTTLLVTENLQAGHWYDTDTTLIGFGLPVRTSNEMVSFGMGSLFESAERPLNTEFEGGSLGASQPQEWQINRDLNAAKGTRPRPSSNHQGGVNVIMCDGSGRFLSDSIDPHVYVKLLTTNGVKYGEGKLNQNSF